ncbi:efflux RND transporter periplasmic adaptor subunit [Hydrogenovibrio sp. 3SP14C1]|uniref:efflux RND transporter periplasmic adaptor subunit n=1 Tax=Hydrogenovibrio sp. 3SP14C1 TaxID=3038774 RepID=UPI002416112B|nr:efflux RND transporter periplasmic adaptor subunit [Hydrogenovibrio sp. 3SP14C1]MDG4811429.1 efflux RND transporter periplasmic adaptor subunit [Hydrogenovibrio sp. 3SP14C1]
MLNVFLKWRGHYIWLMLLTSSIFADDAKPVKPMNSASKAVPVIAYSVKPVSIPVNLKVLGTLHAKESVDITANVTEIVQAIHFKDGQKVRKSQLLVELNSQEELALLEEAKEATEEAKRQYKRVKEIEGRGSVTRSLIDERYRLWKTTEAKRKVIQAQLADRRIYAPFAGQVGFRQLSVGALVQAGTKIVSLDDTSQMKLDLLLPSRYLSNLKIGQAVEIKTNSYPKRRFKGTLRAISPRVESNLRMIQARALIVNPKAELKTNMMVQAFLHLPPQAKLMIPNSAILMLGDRQFVYRLVPSEKPEIYHLQKVEIDTGERKAKLTQVLKGLQKGDLIVSQGLMRISLNKPVQIKAMQSGQSQADLLKKSLPKREMP